MRSSPLRIACAVLVSCAVSIVSVSAANEPGMLAIWKQHLSSPNEHEAVSKACRAFVSANRGDPLIPVVQGIEAWHCLQAGNTADALRLLEPPLSAAPSPLNEGARLLALGWLTRIDREKVVSALQLYYRKEVAYPKDLAALATCSRIPPEAQPPLNDRFGKPWNYQLTGFGKLAGFSDQKYALQSPELGDLSDMKAALKAPYGSHIQVVPVQVMENENHSVAVKFKRIGTMEVILLGLGNTTDGLHLAFVGSRIVIVCDHTHWKLFPKP